MGKFKYSTVGDFFWKVAGSRFSQRMCLHSKRLLFLVWGAFLLLLRYLYGFISLKAIEVCGKSKLMWLDLFHFFLRPPTQLLQEKKVNYHFFLGALKSAVGFSRIKKSHQPHFHPRLLLPLFCFILVWKKQRNTNWRVVLTFCFLYFELTFEHVVWLQFKPYYLKAFVQEEL